MKPQYIYDIYETHCFPATWKVVIVADLLPDGTYLHFSDPLAGSDNATCNYHRTKDDALNTIIKRGGDYRRTVYLNGTTE